MLLMVHYYPTHLCSILIEKMNNSLKLKKCHSLERSWALYHELGKLFRLINNPVVEKAVKFISLQEVNSLFL